MTDASATAHAPLSAARLGVIGGTGALGGAIARRLLSVGAVAPEAMILSNRSGARDGFEAWPTVRVTSDLGALVAGADAILYATPPNAAPRIEGAGKLVLSVMAGVTIEQLERLSGGARVVRAMSSPISAEAGAAYSPFMANDSATAADKALATALFGACGLTDEVFEERHLDVFTALTGPVPGFVAFFAECCVDYAVRAGVPTDVALRAVRQLFKSSGEAMAEDGAPTPAAFVQEMVDYAGTTAAGLDAMRASPIAQAVSDGLDASVAKAKTIARE